MSQDRNIWTLVKDIEALVESRSLGKEAVESFGSHLAQRLTERLCERQPNNTLRMSNFAQPDRKLWYTVNQPEVGEPLNAKVILKFLNGDIIEEQVFFLAEQAGHDVQCRGLQVRYDSIVGHIDGIVDGLLVDVKSASSRGFDKFKRHRLAHDDPFGYYDQLSLYLESLRDHPGLRFKNEFGFLAVNKETGELCLDIYRKKDIDYKSELLRKTRAISGKQPPPRCYDPVPHGASGNKRLPMECSYCPFWKTCWSDANSGAGVRSFLYSTGIVRLVDVKREPEVEEIT